VQPGDVARSIAPGTVCVGDGAVRYRALLEAAGALVPSDDDARHAPGALALAALAQDAPAEPVYVRRPDAEPRVA
jgi:tRNA A37 threonylcarbamoyladenosine modification protein TsaB